MLATTTQELALGRPGAAAIDQVHVTHCLYDEGVNRQAGFTVRAASTRDPLPLRFAQEYPPYELPPGLQAAGLLPGDAPHRLALVRVPGGLRALIHSVPLPLDGRGRANNFFSHVLLAPSLAARDALRLWASPGWVTGVAPEAPKELGRLATLEPGPLNDQAVTAFLQADVGDTDSALATLLCPRRLALDLDRRRELLSMTLSGCLLALQAPPGSPRGRLFLVAEPGLAALLLYGALRLLPPHLGADVTFSTYESMRSLRTYRQAQVVGTWSGVPDHQLDEEFFTTRGYALDTFRERGSRELREKTHPALEEWLDLAGQGDWKLLDTVYRLLGNTGISVVSFQQGFQAAKMAQRLTRGKAEAADLVALKRSPWGPALLEQHRDKVWSLVREAGLRDPELREEFADVISAHTGELEKRVAEAMVEDPIGEWQPSWRLLKAALRDEPSRVRDALQRVLPPPPYASSLRFAVLEEVQDLQALPLYQQPALHSLLKQCTPAELERFAGSGLPREWFIWALCYAVVKGDAQAEAVRHLHEADEALLGAFWEQFKLLKDETQRRNILGPLLAPKDGKTLLFFSRSLKSLGGLRLETLEWVLESLGALGGEWAEFWCSGDHLARLMDVLRGIGDEAEGVWNRLLGYLDADLLLLGNPSQQTLLVNLAGARDRPGPALPAGPAQAITDFVLLREHFEKACALPPDEHVDVIAACNRRNIDAVAVLRRYFERFVLPQGAAPHVTNDFAGFFNSFYEGDEYQDQASRLVGWREVVAGCPDPARREAYLDHYLEEYVQAEFRDRLSEEVLQKTRRVADADAAADVPLGEAPEGPEGPEGAAVDAPVEPRATLDGAGTFALTGVMPVGEGGSVVSALLKGGPWLLVSLAGGLLAAALFGSIRVPPRELLVLCSFVPLVIAVSETAALLSLAAGRGIAGGRRSSWHSMARGLADGALGGAALGVLGGAAAAGAALLWGVPTVNALCVAAAVAAGVLAAVLLGLTLPVLLAPAGRYVAAGPVVRALAGAAALGLYVYASRWLIR